MYKAYGFRMYPNEEQTSIINQTIGNARFVYNHFLNEKITEYKETGKSKTAYSQIKELPLLHKENEWLKLGDSCALRNSIFNMHDAYKNFYNGSGYPKFKKKGVHESYKTNNIKNTYKGTNYESIKLDLENKIITLPKLKRVKIRGYRNRKEIKGNIKSAVISKEAGRYYVSVLVEEELIQPIFIPANIVGIDLGIKDLVITSDFKKYGNNKIIYKYEKRLKRKQRSLSRKQKGSNNYKKLKQEISRIYQKIRNARKFITHHITKEIVNNNDIIVTETLKVKNMVKNHHIAKSLTDASLSEIIRQLEYKTKWKNKKLFKIDPYYPSSQECSVCGYKNERVKDLSVREYECPKCKSYLDRDYNAAINIMFEGVKKYMNELA